MDAIGLLIVILFIVVPFIGVVASRMRDMGQSPPRPLGQGDNRRIQEQIDEFLRRAGQRRAAPPAAQQRPQSAPQPVTLVDEDEVGSDVAGQTRQYLDTSEFRRRSQSMGGEVAQADEQFTQQLQKSFSGEVGRLSARRGDTASAPEVAEANSAPDEGDAEDPSRPMLEALPVAGSGLADLLGAPDNIVQAVIMSEILRRPEW